MRNTYSTRKTLLVENKPFKLANLPCSLKAASHTQQFRLRRPSHLDSKPLYLHMNTVVVDSEINIPVPKWLEDCLHPKEASNSVYVYNYAV